MLITDKQELLKYTTEHRLWQGIPSVEVTKNGRLFTTFYSGNVGERIGNFSMLLKSDDGVTFTEPITVAYKAEHRCYDPCLWIDPLGRLWFTWAEMPNDAAYDDPDAEELRWGEVFRIGEDLMMNKPVVLSSGEWMFPVAIWKRDMRRIYAAAFDETKKPGAYIYKSSDQGKTFERLGFADAPYRDFDEHMILEMQDGRLAVFVRTSYGPCVSYSYDRGKTFTPSVNPGYGGKATRFHIRRLKSGRILLVNHDLPTDVTIPAAGRFNLTAYLSDDDGKTFPHKLMLDERMWVSYPDAAQGADGTIYIIYDRERGGSSLETTYSQAREILLAKITEEDVIAGRLVSPDSTLKQIVSKLGKYADEASNPYAEPDRYSDAEFARHLLEKHSTNLIGKIFETYPVNCVNMGQQDNRILDSFIEKLDTETVLEKKEAILVKIIALIRSVSSAEKPVDSPLVNAVKEQILKSPGEDLSVKDIADRIGVSLYYMLHQFKKHTGITIGEYKTELKLTAAKQLLINSNENISQIAHKCGFGTSSYFSKVFQQSEKISPSAYRKLLKH